MVQAQTTQDQSRVRRGPDCRNQEQQRVDLGQSGVEPEPDQTGILERMRGQDRTRYGPKRQLTTQDQTKSITRQVIPDQNWTRVGSESGQNIRKTRSRTRADQDQLKVGPDPELTLNTEPKHKKQWGVY